MNVLGREPTWHDVWCLLRFFFYDNREHINDSTCKFLMDFDLRSIIRPRIFSNATICCRCQDDYVAYGIDGLMSSFRLLQLDAERIFDMKKKKVARLMKDNKKKAVRKYGVSPGKRNSLRACAWSMNRHLLSLTRKKDSRSWKRKDRISLCYDARRFYWRQRSLTSWKSERRWHQWWALRRRPLWLHVRRPRDAFTVLFDWASFRIQMLCLVLLLSACLQFFLTFFLCSTATHFLSPMSSMRIFPCTQYFIKRAPCAVRFRLHCAHVSGQSFHLLCHVTACLCVDMILESIACRCPSNRWCFAEGFYGVDVTLHFQCHHDSMFLSFSRMRTFVLWCSVVTGTWREDVVLLQHFDVRHNNVFVPQVDLNHPLREISRSGIYHGGKRHYKRCFENKCRLWSITNHRHSNKKWLVYNDW